MLYFNTDSLYTIDTASIANSTANFNTFYTICKNRKKSEKNLKKSVDKRFSVWYDSKAVEKQGSVGTLKIKQ